MSNQPLSVDSLGQDLETALKFIGDGTSIEDLKVDPKDQPALDNAVMAAKKLSRTAATWSILNGVFLLICWIPLFVIAIIFQNLYPGYGALFWSYMYPAMTFVAVTIGIVAWIVPKEQDGYLVLLAQIGFFVSGGLFIAICFHWLRTLLDLIACVNVSWVASIVPLTIGTFGDHTAICGSQGLVITQFIFSCLIMLSAFTVPVLIAVLIARKNRVAAVLFKSKIGQLATKLINHKFSNGLSTQDYMATKSQIGKKIHDLVARASDHGQVIPHLRKNTQELIGHMGLSSQ
jgi:hypothetical protein